MCVDMSIAYKRTAVEKTNDIEIVTNLNCAFYYVDMNSVFWIRTLLNCTCYSTDH